MSTPTAPDSDDISHATDADRPVTHDHPASVHPDPITGEPGAHPIGVGVGALGAGVAGAAIGAIGGPIGVLIGAAIGAVAGGLAGKEVATSSEPLVAEPEEAIGTYASPEEVPVVVPPEALTPVTMSPGEGFRATAGSGFADDLTSDMPETTPLPASPREDMEDDALPMVAANTGVAAGAVTGLQATAVLENEPLAGASASAPTPSMVGEDDLRVSAYYHYLNRTRSGQGGDAVSDWLEAEQEARS